MYIYYTHTHLFPVKESQFHSDTGDIIAPGGEWREFLLYSAQDTSPSTANPEALGASGMDNSRDWLNWLKGTKLRTPMDTPYSKPRKIRADG